MLVPCYSVLLLVLGISIMCYGYGTSGRVARSATSYTGMYWDFDAGFGLVWRKWNLWRLARLATNQQASSHCPTVASVASVASVAGNWQLDPYHV